MNSLAEAVMMVVFICVLVVLAIGIISLPFAFLGWILLSAVTIFTPITITYTASAVLGIAVVIVAGIFSS